MSKTSTMVEMILLYFPMLLSTVIIIYTRQYLGLPATHVKILWATISLVLIILNIEIYMKIEEKEQE